MTMQKDLSQAMLELEDKECEKAVIGVLIAYPSCYYEIGYAQLLSEGVSDC